MDRRELETFETNVLADDEVRRMLSTWTEISQQNLNHFRYHEGDGMQGSSNPLRAT